jgi:hypothetical protein
MSRQNLCAQPNSFNDQLLPMQFAGKTIDTFGIKSTNQRRVLSIVQPNTGITTANGGVLNGGTVEFFIQNGVDRLLGCTLRLGYSNTSGAACVLSPTMSFLTQVQIFADNGTTLLHSTMSPQEAWILMGLSMERTQFEGIAPLIGTNSSYSYSTQSIPNGNSGYLYITLCKAFFNSVKLRPYTINGNLSIRLLFAPLSANIASGSMNINACELLLSGYNESPEQKKLNLSKVPIEKNLFYYGITRDYQTVTLAPSTTYTFKTPGLNGYCAMLCFALSLQSTIFTPGSQFAFNDVFNYQWLDSANSSITGYSNIVAAGFQGYGDQNLLYSSQFSNLFLNNCQIGVFSFSQNPVSDLNSGQNNGYVYLNGQNSITFTTTSSMATGSYQLLSLGFISESLRIVNGNITSVQ